MYQLLYERELFSQNMPILPNPIHKRLTHVVNLDDPNIWAECLQEWAQFFQSAMPMAIKNLFIAHHCDTLRYARICNLIYQPQLWRLWQKDYVYLQREAPRTLDVRAGRTILRVKEVLPSDFLLLEDNDGGDYRKHCRHYAPCHLSIEGTVHPELAVVPKGLSCFVCGEKKNNYHAIVWVVLTWLAHDMLEVTLDFSTIWTVEVSSLSRIFYTWCFHQLYSIIMCGFIMLCLPK